MRILILTNNVTSDRNLQSMLQVLGHEVFTTSRMLHLYLTTKRFKTIKLFDLCIISKTVTNSEANQIVDSIGSISCRIFREVEEITEGNEIRKKTLYKLLKSEQSLGDLREALVSK